MKVTRLVLLFLMSIFFISQAFSTTDGLVVHYDFEGNANDISGNNNHATIYGPIQTTGNTGNAYLFDGVDDYIEINNDASSFLDLDKGTISMWYKSNGEGETYSRLFNVEDNGNEVEIFFSSKISGYHAGNGASSSRAYHNLPESLSTDTNWHHMVYTWDVGLDILSFTLDGVRVEENIDLTPTSSFSTLATIGGRDTYNNFKGTIDEFAIWNKVLSESEITNIYENGIGSVSTCTNSATQSCSTGGQGICSAGTQTCSNNVWGSCSQTNNPTTEICGNGIDEDCNGSDLSCPVTCGNGASQSCSTGGQGICSAGTQTCSNNAWGLCSQSNNPTTEICGNGIDEDCNGSDLSCTLPSSNGILAFPGAEGFGAYAIGGRGGQVIKVTNLNDAGPGSFREAVTTPGPRIVVFEVSGNIILNSRLNIVNPYLTIAGETSPGGITITGGQIVELNTEEVIIRHMRFRSGSFNCEPNDNGCGQLDAFRILDSTNVIIDHSSFSWGVDETFSFSESPTNVTVQWSIISEGLQSAGHPESDHDLGMLISGKSSYRDMEVSVHHNYFAHHFDRFPRIGEPFNGNEVFVDLRNNIAYNWKGKLTPNSNGNSKVNVVSNYNKKGPRSSDYFPFRLSNSATPFPLIYVESNIGPWDDGIDPLKWNVGDGYTGNLISSSWQKMTPWSAPFVTTSTMNYNYALEMLESIGATKPIRDSIDSRVIADFDAGTGGVLQDVSYPEDFHTFQNIAPPTDSDNDGMSDSWESSNGMNVGTADHNGDNDGDGYTNLEEYLHYLAGVGGGSTQPPSICTTGQTQSCSTGGLGICSAGTQSCSNNAWGSCVQDNSPTAEICGDGIDQSCSGSDLVCTQPSDLIPAFPGAEGFGAYAIGGRGGEIIKVTNLNDAGSGSLREALETSGPRIVVFEVSGNIVLNSEIRILEPYLTIAGQTSPNGITMTGGDSIVIQAPHIIIQHMRFRPGSFDCTDCDSLDGLKIYGSGANHPPGASNVIIDHSSISWGVDEVLSMTYTPTNITVQWSMISEGLRNAGHSEGEHGKGVLITPGSEGDKNMEISFHHNFLANNPDRNPEVSDPGAYDVLVDIRNNVIYNWLSTRVGKIGERGGAAHINIVENYNRPGPMSSVTFPFRKYTSSYISPTVYSYRNLGPRSEDDGSNPNIWSVGFEHSTTNTIDEGWRKNTPWLVTPVTTTTMTDSYAQFIVDNVGATKPMRDSIDTRVANDFSTFTGSFMDDVTYPDDFHIFQSLPYPTDSDNDGMSDSWESSKGLNINLNDASGYNLDSDYTNIEIYLHELGGYSSPPSTCTNSQSRSCSTGSPGICSAGTQTCSNEAWGPCVAQNSQTTEICGDGIDQSCSGSDLACPVPAIGGSKLDISNIIADSYNFDINHPSSNLNNGLYSSGGDGSGNIDISSFYIDYDLGNDYLINATRLFADDVGVWSSTSWSLSYKTNLGDSWISHINNMVTSTSDWYTDYNSGFTARYIKLEVFGPSSGTQAREFEIYGTLVGSSPVCGNNIIESGETCDGTNKPSSCGLQGYEHGTIGCFSTSASNSCTYDLSPCYNSYPNINLVSPLSPLPYGTTSTSIELSTDESSSCAYGLNPISFSSMNLFDSTGSLSHQESSISLLQGSQDYTFYVRCRDTHSTPNENLTTISVSVSNPPETNPPQISEATPNGIVLNYGTESTTVSVRTQEESTCKYDIVEGMSYDNIPNTNIFSSTDGYLHELENFLVSDDTSYPFYVKCIDVYDNANTDDYYFNFSVGSKVVIENPIFNLTEFISFSPLGEIDINTNPIYVEIITKELSTCRLSDSFNEFHSDYNLVSNNLISNGTTNYINLDNTLFEKNENITLFVSCFPHLGLSINNTLSSFNFNLGEIINKSNVTLPPIVVPPVDKPKKSGGGGGSSSSNNNNLKILDTSICQPRYSANSWTSCLDGIQKRIVTDRNNCEEDKTESRICFVKNNEIENKYLNAKDIKIFKDKDRKRTYKTNLTSSYNEIFRTESMVDEKSFILIDDLSGNEYLGKLIEENEGDFFYSLERIDESSLADLKFEGLIDTSSDNNLNSGFKNFLSSQLGILFVSIISILLMIGFIIYLVIYIKKIHE